MVDRDTFDRRLDKLEQIVGHLRELGSLERHEVLADPGRIAQMERWLHLAAECSIDLAHHVIASEGWSTPTTYREAFQTLERRGVLQSELADRMAEWAGLRNLLVHVYLGVDHDRLFDVVVDELDQIQEYAAALVAFVDE